MAKQTKPVEVPEDITALDNPALDALVESAKDEIQAIAADRDTAGEKEANRATELATFVKAVAALQTERAAEAEETRQSIDDALAAVAPAEDGDGEETGDGDEGGDEPGDGEGDDAETEDADGEDDAEETPAETEAPSGVQSVTKQAASVRRGAATGSLVRGARRPSNAKQKAAAGVREERQMGMTITAAAGHRDLDAGSVIPDMAALAEAFIDRSDVFPKGIATERNVRMQHGVARIKRNFAGLHVESPDFESAWSAMQYAASIGRVGGDKSLIAAGWCAPSETIYTLPALNASLDGILDTPTIGVGRGGINATLGPDWFSDIFGSAGFAQTEAEAIAGTTKACVDVDCPDFTETRLDAVGFCVRAGLLTRAAFSELVQGWLEGTQIANAHKVNKRRITGIQTLLGSAVTIKDTSSAAQSLLSGIELLIEGERSKRRLRFDFPMEVKAPHWLKGALRADLAGRNGIGLDRVTDAVLDGHFADRSAMVQWLYDYQDSVIGTADKVVDYPDTAEVMVYPAGTFVTGMADVIALDTIYDTAGLQTNNYTAAFVEDGVFVRRMGYGGARANVAVKITGFTGPLSLAAFQTTDA